MKQTSVEELIESVEIYYKQILGSDWEFPNKEYYLKKEKEQISNAFLKGYDYCNSRDLEEQDDDFEFDFYKETYGGNK